MFPRYVKLAPHRHDRAQSGTMHLGTVVSIVLHEANTVLGLFCLRLNLIGRSCHKTSNNMQRHLVGVLKFMVSVRTYG